MIAHARLPLVAWFVLTAAAGCSTNPATGESSFTAFMSPAQEKQVGAEQHPKLVQEFGGNYDDAKVAAYVERVGQSLAKHSEIQDIQYSFTVIDDDDINAFALPGGYIHVTRGLLALASNEAELAGVLGHEIGHVTARHAAQRYSTATADEPRHRRSRHPGRDRRPAAPVADVAGSGLQTGAAVYLQSYSRDQELEADRLGIRYMTAGRLRSRRDGQLLPQARRLHPPRGGEGGRSGRRRPLRHHGLAPAHRRPGAAGRRSSPQRRARPGEELDRQRYLQAIDGIIYGDSPQQGFRRGRDFIHPGLRIAFRVPEGFVLKNGPQQVAAVGPGRRADRLRRRCPRRCRSAGARHADLSHPGLGGEDAARRGSSAFRSTAWRRRPARRDCRPEAASSMSAWSPSAATRDRIWRFVFLSRPMRRQRLQSAFQSTAMSFRQLSAQEAAAIKPWRIDVDSVQAGRHARDAGVAHGRGYATSWRPSGC